MTPSLRPTRSRCSSPTCAASSRPTVSRVCCIRSEEPATSFAHRPPTPESRFDRLPIRVRLAGVSALLTFVILCGFAVAVGSLTVRRIRSDFNREVADTAQQLPSQLSIKVNPAQPRHLPDRRHRSAARRPRPARGLGRDQDPLARRRRDRPNRQSPARSGPPRCSRATSTATACSAVPPRSASRARASRSARCTCSTAAASRTPRRPSRAWSCCCCSACSIGTGLALLAGMTIARRAMAPIARLTVTAAEIARTRDPSRVVPQSEADDEVSELARTLQGMLRELDAARGETEAMLVAPAPLRRRRLARAAHAADERARQPRAARRIAPRRSGRGGALGAALLPADAPAGRGPAAAGAHRRRARDPPRAVRPGPDRRRGRLRAGTRQRGARDLARRRARRPVLVQGSRDELHRLTINLLENALRHTPAGTEIRVSSSLDSDGQARLVVEDDGPGVPEHLRETLFERFVRGAGDRGGSFGLGLAIVRAVAETHGGSVAVEATGERDGASYGARFIVTLPAAPAAGTEKVAQTSTTTGKTIGRGSAGHRLASPDRRAAPPGAGPPRGSAPSPRA